MNSPQLAPGPAAPRRNWTRHLVNALVALMVIAVAGATFVFTYAGVHAIALLGGVPAQLARYYPMVFDAVLVIACVSLVMLRDGRWWARTWAWLVTAIILGAIGTSDVLHAMNYALRHRLTEGIVAAAPVVAVLLAFSLLLTLLRQSKAHVPPAAGATSPAEPGEPAESAEPADQRTGPIAAVAVPAVPVPVLPPTGPVPVPADGPVPDAAQAQTDPAPAAVPEALQDALPDDDAPSESPGGPGQPAPPTVEVPAVTLSAVPERSQGIRYAGGGVRDTPPGPDHGNANHTDRLAGVVYRARDDDDAPADRPATRPHPPELDHDAPPFAAVPRLNRLRSMPAPPADEDE